MEPRELSQVALLYLQGGSHVKVKATAALLAFFLGGFGVHKFYLGEGGGVVRIILTCSLIGAPISGIWALVDFVKLLGMDDAEFDHAYNSQGGTPSQGTTSNTWKIVAGAGIGAIVLVAGCIAVVAVAVEDAVGDIESSGDYIMPTFGAGIDESVKDNVGMMGPRPTDAEIRRACQALRNARWDYMSMDMMSVDMRSMSIAASITLFASGNELVNYCNSK